MEDEKANHYAAIVRRVTRTGRPTLTARDAARVRELLEDERDKVHGGNAAQLARALGIKPPSLHKILDNGSPAYPTLLALARMRGFGDDVQRMLGKPPPADSVEADPYPLRRELRALSEFKAAPPEVQATIIKIRNKRGDYTRIDDWLAELRAEVRRFERGEHDKLRPGEEVDDVEDPDDGK